MTDAEIAAENDKVMGDYSICHECAETHGGHAPPFSVWSNIGTCKACREIKDCYHMRDYGLNPKRFDRPDIAVGG